MRYLPLLLALGATPALSQSSQVENCWIQGITVTAIDFSPAIIEEREIKAEVYYTENARRPLGAIEIAFEIWSNERPLPLYSGYLRKLRSIDGAMLPGETLETSDFHFMEDREKALARSAGELTIHFEVQGAKDDQGEPVVPNSCR